MNPKTTITVLVLTLITVIIGILALSKSASAASAKAVATVSEVFSSKEPVKIVSNQYPNIKTAKFVDGDVTCYVVDTSPNGIAMSCIR